MAEQAQDESKVQGITRQDQYKLLIAILFSGLFGPAFDLFTIPQKVEAGEVKVAALASSVERLTASVESLSQQIKELDRKVEVDK